jgi:hypothetical protein
MMRIERLRDDNARLNDAHLILVGFGVFAQRDEYLARTAAIQQEAEMISAELQTLGAHEAAELARDGWTIPSPGTTRRRIPAAAEPGAVHTAPCLHGASRRRAAGRDRHHRAAHGPCPAGSPPTSTPTARPPASRRRPVPHVWTEAPHTIRPPPTKGPQRCADGTARPGGRHGRRAFGCRAMPDYAQLPDAARERLRSTARTRAVQAAQHCADLLAAEAGIAARAVYPTVVRLVFQLSVDVFGASATLVAAYTADGWLLWHVDTGDEWPDESLVTDFLAAAAGQLDDYFPTVSATDLTEDGAQLYALDLRPPTSRA